MSHPENKSDEMFMAEDVTYMKYSTRYALNHGVLGGTMPPLITINRGVKVASSPT